ncbi:inactive beta-amylase 9-like [Andrographis paniculata]|uniref:inactive beta-amylase 9-like n=1 Tax=Andrographis paniculata TaxID=175694 RepID=UPI0021E92A85|nr:inactive beta-amylase 9-like [Andrographis paniculata]
MEVSVIGSSQVNLTKVNDTGFCNYSRSLNAKIWRLKNSNSKGCNFVRNRGLSFPSRSETGCSLRASASVQTEALVSEKASEMATTRPIDGVKLYVGLPLDTVSASNTLNHARAIAAGLKALKLLGVDGVQLPLWWGIAEQEAAGKYNWSGYRSVVEMIQNLNLELHISLNFHAPDEEYAVSLPQWINRIGESDPSIFFTNRSGQQYKNCLSLAVDDLPVLDGKTPLEVYKCFFENFKSEFSPFFGSTIKSLSIGLGPDGELRYPSNNHPSQTNSHLSAGEFQCYDKHMLLNLKNHAESHSNPLWGLGGPHDAPTHDQSPLSGNFFAEHGGSWETPYGDFFLSWYSGELERHGDQILSLAASTFSDSPVTLAGKLPLEHAWSNLRSHPSELTSGFYNTANRDGYDDIVDIFARNSCRMILPGMELSDEDFSGECRSGPGSLFDQIVSSCGRRGVGVSGQNLSPPPSSSLAGGGFRRIKENLLSENGVVDLFMYQRMGAYFFSPEHFPAFTQFVRSLNQAAAAEQSSDDLPVEGAVSISSAVSGMNLQMQATV